MVPKCLITKSGYKRYYINGLRVSSEDFYKLYPNFKDLECTKSTKSIDKIKKDLSKNGDVMKCQIKLSECHSNLIKASNDIYKEFQNISKKIEESNDISNIEITNLKLKLKTELYEREKYEKEAKELSKKQVELTKKHNEILQNLKETRDNYLKELKTNEHIKKENEDILYKLTGYEASKKYHGEFVKELKDLLFDLNKEVNDENLYKEILDEIYHLKDIISISNVKLGEYKVIRSEVIKFLGIENESISTEEIIQKLNDVSLQKLEYSEKIKVLENQLLDYLKKISTENKNNQELNLKIKQLQEVHIQEKKVLDEDIKKLNENIDNAQHTIDSLKSSLDEQKNKNLILNKELLEKNQFIKDFDKLTSIYLKDKSVAIDKEDKEEDIYTTPLPLIKQDTPIVVKKTQPPPLIDDSDDGSDDDSDDDSKEESENSIKCAEE